MEPINGVCFVFLFHLWPIRKKEGQHTLLEGVALLASCQENLRNSWYVVKKAHLLLFYDACFIQKYPYRSICGSTTTQGNSLATQNSYSTMSTHIYTLNITRHSYHNKFPVESWLMADIPGYCTTLIGGRISNFITKDLLFGPFTYWLPSFKN